MYEILKRDNKRKKMRYKNENHKELKNLLRNDVVNNVSRS